MSLRRKKYGGANKSDYQRQLDSHSANKPQRTTVSDAERRMEYRSMKQMKGDLLDKKFEIERFVVNSFASDRNRKSAHELKRRGWLFNILPTTVSVSNDASTAANGGPERSGLDLYFWSESGDNFKSTVLYRPYFYVLPDISTFEHQHSYNHDSEFECASEKTSVLLELLVTNIARVLDGYLYHIETVYRIDLDQTNHLSPINRHGRPILKLIFDNVSQLTEARTRVRDIIAKNKDNRPVLNLESFSRTSRSSIAETEDLITREPLRFLVDLREYDVPYIVRVCTDLDIRVGTWYTVCLESESVNKIYSIKNQQEDNGGVKLTEPDRESKAGPTVFAFDIECTKAPLKFPTAEVDEIFMISYMVSTHFGGQGYLIVSRSVVSQDIDDFEYTPKPTLPGPFHIFNEENEKKLLQRFFTEFRKNRPQIVVTYNGDFFDWPFVEARAKSYGIDMYEEIGVEGSDEGYRGRCCVHMDAFHWVQRDSYLPQGSQGLKAVTKYKLKYDPVEVDPEDMVKFARDKPVHMATYSVSDAVATYYLYENYVHLFIFSLCTIIPMGPEDVLRKGSGTLCETLLMAQAYRKNIICPNKHVEDDTQFFNGHLLESETYIGGKVECLETGVYRSDIEYDFDLKSSAFDQLIENIDRDLMFAIQVEGGKNLSNIVNYDQIRNEITGKLKLLRDRPKRHEKPFVYHLDVGAMYPNIILTNRLQPSSIVNDAICTSCDFNHARNGCKRPMDWVWRGDFNPSTFQEYDRTLHQLERENMATGTSFHDLSKSEQAKLVSNRLKTYANKAYKKTKITQEQNRKDIVCMRENDFYVSTVREFRDRRYEYKRLNKSWNKKLAEATDAAAKKLCEDRILIYDSLQIAHKCILNSFYGYVMRKGARWRSMEMAGIVTKTGSDIITQARILVEQIGRPLELDTDGIWCILPQSFPDIYTFELDDGSKLKLEYPCAMLNADIHEKFTNHQYQSLVDPVHGTYSTRSECSIFFEVDGPYRCMVLPASTEEGKLLKKRYAVFNHDGTLAELKGFELKRRGELELIKTFQSQVFERFLHGNTLQECYGAVAEVANHWIDVIDTRGISLDDDELIDLISENRNMSRQLDEYGDQKGTSQTTARRLSEFLGTEIIKDKGLNCKFIIAEQPFGAPVTDRAIPTAIWKSDPAVMKHHLRKWLKAPGLDGDGFDIRNVLDWDYYLDRLSKTIQKIITIPAALQKVSNPVPRIEHPAWLDKKIRLVNDRFQQRSIKTIFAQPLDKDACGQKPILDVEDTIGIVNVSKAPVVVKHSKCKKLTSDKRLLDKDEKVHLKLSIDNDNFKSWLAQRQVSWRKLRTQNRLEAKASETRGPSNKKQKKARNLEGFARDASLSLIQNEWHVLEVREMSSFESPHSLELTGSGEFVVWAMVGSDYLQKIIVHVPRIIYISTRIEVKYVSDDILYLRKVDKHLPHGKSSTYLYEMAMSENVYKSNKWISHLKPSDEKGLADSFLESIFESGTPLITRILTEMGSICKLSPTANRLKNKAFNLSDIQRIDRPSGDEYLSKSISYQRLFLYIRIHPKTKTGIVALYHCDQGSGSYSKDNPGKIDVTRPSSNSTKGLNVGATCRVWIIKPNAKGGQRNISVKHVEKILRDTMQNAASTESEYSFFSPESTMTVSTLDFVETDDLAFVSANEFISAHSKSNPGPCLILLNSSFGLPPALRRRMSTFSSLPVISMAFPPFPDHNPELSKLPSLNWEQPAFQLSFEAYMHVLLVSFPNLISYARYGQVPLGNLTENENIVLYEISLMRLIHKNRALSWASLRPGSPDVGLNIVSCSDTTSTFQRIETESFLCSQDEIWGDDDELINPVIRNPGCYRSICVDLDVQDLTVAALTSAFKTALINPSLCQGKEINQTSPSSVTFFGNGFNVHNDKSPFGDEVTTSISLQMIRALVGGWLKDAITTNSTVADELLHHVYLFLSDPNNLLHDPALHRVVHSLMKDAFLLLLTELKRLGCMIVFASFNKVIVATNKIDLADAQEYIKFVVDTARRQNNSNNNDQSEVLSKLSLRPRQFHSNLIFLDECNFGTVHLERVSVEDLDEQSDKLAIPEGSNGSHKIVPFVVTAWSLMNYLGNESAQKYFRAIVGKFSKEVFIQQVRQDSKQGNKSYNILELKKSLISDSFAKSLTRAVGEIMNEGVSDNSIPYAHANHRKQFNPALEFVKNVVAVLGLDTDVENEIQSLRRSLFAQIGIAEYSNVAHWVNPCMTFVLPDVFCSECKDCRDLNLCYIPPPDDGFDRYWICEDCSNPYNDRHIESRLILLLQRKLVRFHLQDLRCSKTKQVASRTLTRLSDNSETLRLDITLAEIQEYIHLLRSIADLHDLELLRSMIDSLLSTFSS